jgi:cell wall-associated NlpC family hydrolase
VLAEPIGTISLNLSEVYRREPNKMSQFSNKPMIEKEKVFSFSRDARKLFAMRVLVLVIVVVASVASSVTYSAEDRPEVPSVVQNRSLTEASQELIFHALAFVGVHYKWGGRNPETGLDCSGFVHHVFKDALGVVLPPNAHAMSGIGRTIAMDRLQPGDLVFFNTLRHAFSHVGIYIGENRFVHAPRTGKTIEFASLGSPYWATRFNGARRVLDPDPRL